MKVDANLALAMLILAVTVISWIVAFYHGVPLP